MHLKAIVRRTIYYFNASDHHVKFDTGQCCNNRRMCFLNDPIEQIGLILDKIKFYLCTLTHLGLVMPYHDMAFCNIGFGNGSKNFPCDTDC